MGCLDVLTGDEKEGIGSQQSKEKKDVDCSAADQPNQLREARYSLTIHGYDLNIYVQCMCMYVHVLSDIKHPFL